MVRRYCRVCVLWPPTVSAFRCYLTLNQLTVNCFCLQVLPDGNQLLTYNNTTQLQQEQPCQSKPVAAAISETLPSDYEASVLNAAGLGAFVFGGGAKQHQCAYCTYSTDNVTRLRSHTMIHTGERPHACPHCTYRSVWKHTLHRHIKFKHVTQTPGLSTYNKERI